MKLFVLFLFVFNTQLSARSYSQSINLKGKNISLKEAFKQVEKQTGYSFFIKNKLLKKAETINISLRNATFDEAMRVLLKEQRLTYVVIGKTVILEKLEIPIINQIADEVPLPDRRITGTVKDAATGQPLVGVSVIVKGTRVGATTDAGGNYSLVVNEDMGVLVFSMVGYNAVERVIDEGNEIDVTLEQDVSGLSEVVVTALGINREQRSLTYAVTEIKGDLMTQARENNLGNALSGRIAGVNATMSANGLSGSSRVLIRGNGSLSGDNQPLYVVNGIPISNSNLGTPGTYGGTDQGDGLNSINPDDIESISVLKGGTAAALYGSRAANGVILITTKSGKANKGIGVQLNSTYTIERPLVYHDWQYEYGAGTRGSRPVSKSEAIADGRTSWGEKLDGQPTMNPDGVERPYSPQKKNMQHFYDVGKDFSNTLAIYGGTETANFRFSVGDLDNKGIVPNSSVNRKVFSLNANGNLSDKIIFNGDAQYSIELTKNRTGVADFTNNPNASVGLIATNIDVRTLSPGYDENNFEVPWNDYQYVTNPYFAVNRIKNEDERRRFIGSFSIRYNFIQDFYVRARTGIDYFNRSSYSITPTGIMYRPAGQMSEDRRVFYETNSELLIGWDKSFGDFSLNSIVGANRMYNNNSSVGLSSGPFAVPFKYFIGNGTSQTFSKSFSESEINSIFGSIDLSYKDYLYLTLTGREDWFSTLSINSNHLFYPSVGLGFVFSSVLDSKPEWFDFGKLRASWAQVGGGAPAPYGTKLTYAGSSITHLGQQLMNILGQQLMSQTGSTIPNNLKPYQSITTEIGMETWFLNRRIGLDLTFYDRETKNDIVPVSVAAASGYRNILLNVGKIRNRGIEALITGRPVKNINGLSWDASFNFAYNDNQVVRLAEGLSNLVGGTPRTQNAWIYHIEGMPYGMIAGYTNLKDDNGNLVYNSLTGLPIQSEIVPLGRGVPPITMGLTNDFRFKNFTLSLLVDGKFGSSLYSATAAYGTYYGLDKRTVKDGVRETGVSVDGVDENGNSIHTVVDAQTYYQDIAFKMTDQFVSKAGFLKLRQLIFGYTFPNSITSKTPFQSLSLSFVARNLLMLYSQIKGVDPESSYSVSGDWIGLENQGVPATRTFGLNLMATF